MTRERSVGALGVVSAFMVGKGLLNVPKDLRELRRLKVASCKLKVGVLAGLLVGLRD